MNEEINKSILKSNTSLVGIVCKDGVVMGSDRRVTAGNLVMDKNYRKILEINDYIVADNGICHGKPTFTGTRIMVHIVLEMLRAGASYKEIIEAYPSLSIKHIRAALDFAAHLAEKNFELVSA